MKPLVQESVCFIQHKYSQAAHIILQSTILEMIEESSGRGHEDIASLFFEPPQL